MHIFIYIYQNYLTKWKKILLLISNISILCLIYIYKKNQNEIVSFGYGSIDDVNLITCDPIKKNNTQYSVNIDNAKYPKFVPLHQNTSINFDCLNNSSKTKIILMWIDWWGGRDYLSVKNGENQFKVRNCPVTNCKVIDDKTKVNDTDLVVVHGLDFDLESPRPKKRPSNQRWVIAYYESPSYKSLNNDSFKDVFNLTATYHIDSDFPGLYSSTSQIKWELNEDFDENYDYTTNKIDLAAAVISNNGGHVTSNRLLLIAELRKYMILILIKEILASINLEIKQKIRQIL